MTDEGGASRGRKLAVELRLGRETVPGIFLLPAPRAKPAPAALLVHGWTSHKEQMAGSVGAALQAEGIASLALDLPMHGERESPEAMSQRSPVDLVRRWTVALAEASLGVRYLAERPEVDAGRIGIVGYSLGSFVAVMTAAREQSVRAIVLAAGGDLPAGTPFERVLRAVADPARAIRKLEGRPLLMVHGRRDRTVRPEQAERLFAAAGEPKELRWWDSGHYLPKEAIGDAAVWMKKALGQAEIR